MSGINSPIESAYRDAVSNRLFSLVYFALNEGVPPVERKSFREDWIERGTDQLIRLLFHCASPDWSFYPETFWVNPWVAERLRASEAYGMYYVLERWLANYPLPPLVSDDPREEDRKVKDQARLFAALNP